MEYKIFAHHAHVFPKETRPEGTVEKLKEYLEVCEIEKCVCFAPFKGHFDFHGIKDEPNEFLAQQIANEKNLYGFGSIDFDRDDIEQQIEKIANYGFYGIKLHPAYQEFNLLCDKAKRVYAEAEKRNLFLSFHTGIHWHRISDYNMLMYDEIAYLYPKLRFSMEHLGGYHFFRDGLAVMVNNSRNDVLNTFAGWTTINMDSNNLADYWSHTNEELMTLLHQTSPDAHIFGLDFPYHDTEYSKAAIKRIINLDIEEETKRKILGENLARELKIDF